MYRKKWDNKVYSKVYTITPDQTHRFIMNYIFFLIMNYALFVVLSHCKCNFCLACKPITYYGNIFRMEQSGCLFADAIWILLYIWTKMFLKVYYVMHQHNTRVYINIITYILYTLRIRIIWWIDIFGATVIRGVSEWSWRNFCRNQNIM